MALPVVVELSNTSIKALSDVVINEDPEVELKNRVDFAIDGMTDSVKSFAMSPINNFIDNFGFANDNEPSPSEKGDSPKNPLFTDSPDSVEDLPILLRIAEGIDDLNMKLGDRNYLIDTSPFIATVTSFGNMVLSTVKDIIPQEQYDRITESLESMQKDFKEGLENDEKRRFEDEKAGYDKPEVPTTEPTVPTPKSKGLVENLLDFMGLSMLSSVVGRAMSIGLVAAAPAMLSGIAIAAVGGVVEAFRSWDLGETIASSIGASSGVGGITQIFTGIDGDILSTLGTMGRWAAVGALAGSVVPVVGTVAGGIAGAAIGGVVSGITNLMGFDNIVSAVDKAVDFGNSALEKVFGADTERLEGRRADMDRAISEQNTLGETYRASLADAEVKLKEAKASGNTADVAMLEQRISDLNTSIAESASKSEEFKSRRDGFQSELDWANTTWAEYGLSLLKDVKDSTLSFGSSLFTTAQDTLGYITSIPLRFVDSVKNFIMGNDPFESFKMSTEDFFDTSSIVKLLRDSVNGVFESIFEIFNTAANAILEFPAKIYEGAKSYVTGTLEEKFSAVSQFFDVSRLWGGSKTEAVPNDSAVVAGEDRMVNTTIAPAVTEETRLIDTATDSDIMNRVEETTNNNDNTIKQNVNASNQTVVNNSTNIITDKGPARNMDPTFVNLDSGFTLY